MPVLMLLVSSWSFKTHVERLIDRKIKCVQFDWGGEYQKIHNTFFRPLGITHRVSCPHTHQQNGSAERKHHHIVETGLALLAHAHIPIKFWDDAFLTATYLINRMCGRTNLNYTGSSTRVHSRGLQRASNGIISWPVG
jgi:hypothetical protein